MENTNSLYSTFLIRDIPFILKSHKRAFQHVTLLMEVEDTGNMRTLNHDFALTLSKLMLQRINKRLALANSWTVSGQGYKPVLRLSDILDAHKSNDDQLIEDLDDKLA